MKRRFDGSKTYYGPGVPYRDPERVLMLLLLIGIMIGLVIFLAWAIS